MVYSDTSVLLALFLNETRTADAWRWVKQQPPRSIHASDWTFTELSSAWGVKRRMNAIDDSTHGTVLSAVKRFTATHLTLITPASADFHRAAILCNRWGE